MIVVTNTNDSGAGSLRQAIADATSGEEITFSITGTITLTSAELEIADDLIITGPGSSDLAITGSGGFRIFNVTAGIVFISGLTISNGEETNGGGVNNETTLALNDVIVTGCTADADGGGIYSFSTLTMTNCAVRDCVAAGLGGGIYNSGTVTAVSFDVTGNTADSNGGGIWNSGTFDQTGGTISTNESGVGSGGGVFNSGTIAFTECTITANTADTISDALMNSLGTVTITRCTVSYHATPAVSAIFNYLGTLTIASSTLSGNTDAAALYNAQGAITISNSTITANGTGIKQDSGSPLTIYNTILCGNTTQDLTSDAVDVTSSGANILGTYSNAITPTSGDQIDVAIAAVHLTALQNNGGPTFTHGLLTGSVALDSGDNTDAPATDQRGAPRIFNNTIDIGAVESTVCLNFSGTLPAWLSLASNCLQVTSGSFRGATKDAANAAAQAALDAFVDASIDNSTLECVGMSSCPTIPAFETTTQNLTLTSAEESANRPGSYTHQVTFSGVAGQTVNIWMDSTDFSTYLFLMDPGMAVLASDDGTGLEHNGPTRTTAALHYTLPSTGTYTIDCTSVDPGETGDFTLVICANPVTENVFGVSSGNFMRDLVYAPDVNRLFCFNQIGAFSDDAGIYVADGCTGELLTSFFMPDSVPPEFIYNALGAVYNSVNGQIYVIRSDGTLYSLNPVSYVFTSILANAANPFDDGHGIAFDPVNNRVFIGITAGGGYTDEGIRVIDCLTNTELDLVDMGGPVSWVAYADTGFIYASVGTAVKKLDTTTLAVTSSGLTCKNGARLATVVEKQLLFINTTAFFSLTYDIADYTVDAIVDSKNGSFSGMQDAVWSPFESRIMISSYGTLGNPGQGVAFYDPDTNSIDNFISITEAAGIVYVASSNSVFVTSRSAASLFKIV